MPWPGANCAGKFFRMSLLINHTLSGVALDREWGNVVKRCLLALVLAAALTAAAGASAEEDSVVDGARDFVADIGDRTIAVLTDTSNTKEEIKIGFNHLFADLAA